MMRLYALYAAQIKTFRCGSRGVVWGALSRLRVDSSPSKMQLFTVLHIGLTHSDWRGNNAWSDVRDRWLLIESGKDKEPNGCTALRAASEVTPTKV